MLSGYAYLYDERLNDRKHDREISRLEAEISSRGLNGRVGKFAMFRHAKDIVADLIRSGAHTLVIVGDEKTLFTAIGALGGAAPTLGFLPMLGEGLVGKGLAIPKGVASVNTLAGRFIEEIDVGIIGLRWFLTEIYADGPGLSIRVDDRFTLQPPPGGSIRIRNLGQDADVHDGELDLFIELPQQSSGFPWKRPNADQGTHLRFKKAVLYRSVSGTCTSDGAPIDGETLEITTVPGALKLITGRRGRVTLAGSAVV